jgi:hypothetical protein
LENDKNVIQNGFFLRILDAVLHRALVDGGLSNGWVRWTDLESGAASAGAENSGASAIDFVTRGE